MFKRSTLAAALLLTGAAASSSAQSERRIEPGVRRWVELGDEFRISRRPTTYRYRFDTGFRRDLVERAVQRASAARIMAEDRARMADRVRSRMAERVRTDRLHQLDRAFDLRERTLERTRTALRRQSEVRERMMERLNDRLRFRFDDGFPYRARRYRPI